MCVSQWRLRGRAAHARPCSSNHNLVPTVLTGADTALKRVLFCWELGANFGHLALAEWLSARLPSDGWEIVYAVTDLRAARQFLGPQARLVQSPVWPAQRYQGAAIGPVSQVDILAMLGFHNSEQLATMIGAWRTLFALVEPHVLVADHSPTVSLAARIEQRPLIATGTPFTMPPLGFPTFPPLRGDLAPAMPEHRMQAAIDTALREHGYSVSMPTLPAYFASQARIVIGLPELDPYRSFRQEQLFTPPGGLPAVLPIPERRLFGYLGGETPDLAGILQAICALDFPVELFLRGVDDFTREFVRLSGKTLHTDRVDFRQTLPTVSHVISLAGAATTTMTLAAGRPHLMLPQHHETRLNAAMVERMGAGFEVKSALETRLADFVGDYGLQEGAIAAANVLSQRPLPDSGARLIEAVTTLA